MFFLFLSKKKKNPKKQIFKTGGGNNSKRPLRLTGLISASMFDTMIKRARLCCHLGLGSEARHQCGRCVAGVVLFDEADRRVDDQQHNDTHEIWKIWRFSLQKLWRFSQPKPKILHLQQVLQQYIWGVSHIMDGPSSHVHRVNYLIIARLRSFDAKGLLFLWFIQDRLHQVSGIDLCSKKCKMIEV